MSDELEQRIEMLEAARLEFSDARTDALRVAVGQMAELQPTSSAVESAEMFDRLVAITDRALAAERDQRQSGYMLG